MTRGCGFPHFVVPAFKAGSLLDSGLCAARRRGGFPLAVLLMGTVFTVKFNINAARGYFRHQLFKLPVAEIPLLVFYIYGVKAEGGAVLHLELKADYYGVIPRIAVFAIYKTN